MKHVTGFLLATIIALLFASIRAAQALPAFARKYETSCATCHDGFPKLNPFGDAFRRNGYQFPEGKDAQFTKEQPVPLGAEGQKRAFPDAIWPGTIPGSSPISILLSGAIEYNPHAEPRFTFGGLGNDMEFAAAGTLGENLAFWGQLAVSEDEGVELGRNFLDFSNLIGHSFALNARVGKFEPGVFLFSVHRSWFEDFWITTRPFSDNMDWTLEETQKGIELNGMVRGRFAYTAGVVEGYGAPHSEKDVYAHVMHKWGGLRLDGVESGSIGASGWGERSLSLGVFAYRGCARLGMEESYQRDGFIYWGGDYNLWCPSANLFGGVAIRHDRAPFLALGHHAANSAVWFSELDAALYPWLLPGIRYEWWRSETLTDPGTRSYVDQRFLPGVVMLLRANVKFTLRTSIERAESEDRSSFRAEQALFVLTVGV